MEALRGYANVISTCGWLSVHRHGAVELQLRAAVPNIAALAADPSAAVRDAAVQLLADMYRHVGESSRPPPNRPLLSDASTLLPPVPRLSVAPRTCTCHKTMSYT